MLFFVSERACHSTATGVDFFYGIGECERLFQVAGSDQRLFMAVSMNQRLRLLPLQLQFPPACLLFFDNEFLEKERSLGDILSMMAFDEIRVFVPESQNATRLAADNGITLVDELVKLVEY